MENFTVGIKSIGLITRDVLQIFVQKPERFDFIPGQAAEIAINKTGWQNERRPFTFTSLPDDEYLQFTIKTYPSRNGVTNELLKLKRNDELIIYDVFGAIAYKGEGLFIAGGAGVTPFISIFRYLNSIDAIGNNRLIAANKLRDDIILKYEFARMLEDNFINVLSDEDASTYLHGYITKDLLSKHISDFKKPVYLCGPPPMMDAVEKILSDLNFNPELLVKEAV
jgi:ferredoxin-NADP reductase